MNFGTIKTTNKFEGFHSFHIYLLRILNAKFKADHVAFLHETALVSPLKLK